MTVPWPSEPQAQPAAVAGVYEVGIGVQDLTSTTQYWQQFGYRIGQQGQLPPEVATKLYGVDSSLYATRLYHQEADHGLIRLMVWEKPVNEGLGMASMKVKGNRWAATLTADVLNILNHVEEGLAAGWPIRYIDPQWAVIYKAAGKGRPFMEPAIGVREMMLLQPLTRQILFERFNYTLPQYGNINESAFFKTSQITHVGMVIQDDSLESLRFYESVLGLLCVHDNVASDIAEKASRQIFDLQPNEEYFTTDFDDPRSSKQNLAMRSGRLKIIRFPAAIKLENQLDRARPGCLGMSLYTYRVRGLDVYFNRVKASQAQQVTEILLNEFGERSFSFIAPDGYFWTLVEV